MTVDSDDLAKSFIAAIFERLLQYMLYAERISHPINYRAGRSPPEGSHPPLDEQHAAIDITSAKSIADNHRNNALDVAVDEEEKRGTWVDEILIQGIRHRT